VPGFRFAPGAVGFRRIGSGIRTVGYGSRDTGPVEVFVPGVFTEREEKRAVERRKGKLSFNLTDEHLERVIDELVTHVPEHLHPPGWHAFNAENNRRKASKGVAHRNEIVLSVHAYEELPQLVKDLLGRPKRVGSEGHGGEQKT